MKSFKDIPFDIRIETLKALPLNSDVEYINPSSGFHKMPAVKILDGNSCMTIQMANNKRLHVSYKRLSCKGFDSVIFLYKNLQII